MSVGRSDSSLYYYKLKNKTEMEILIIALVALAVLVSRVGKVNEKKLFDKSQSEYFDYKLNKMIKRESVRILL